MLFSVGEIESNRVDASASEGLGERDHEWASLTRASAVAENQCRYAWLVGAVGERHH